MAIYLADDFVFTKNGISHKEPWVIMNLRDMIALYYMNREGGGVLVFRKKEFLVEDIGARSALLTNRPLAKARS
jgi:hypothetical protein